MQVTYTRPGKRFTLAALSPRLLAGLIDFLLLSLVFATLDYFTFSSNENALLLKPERLLHILLGWVYFAGAESCSG
ncbi:hypothetical protein [Pontibacter liquoris]|uniref:hypothetical protein n=1 Tax=Pontibacter liquoris TaxID=2905677 RepID=UPI001FA76DCE|nr:hypothetical protein [Pontibacter liquoris]